MKIGYGVMRYGADILHFLYEALLLFLRQFSEKKLRFLL